MIRAGCRTSARGAHARRQNKVWLAVLLVPTLLSVSDASAQQVKLGLDAGPYYVGDAISVRLTASGFEDAPAPAASIPTPASGRLEFLSMSPSVSTSLSIINGRMTRTREVKHVFQYRFVPSKPGNVLLGPFRVRQGASEAVASRVRLPVQAVPSSDSVKVVLRLPEEPVFVGERVPITVEFSLDQRLRENLLGYELGVPAFDLQQRFRFLDDEESQGDTKVSIETAAGRLELMGHSREVRRNGKVVTLVSVARTLVPLVPGSQVLPPTTISLQEGMAWRRDFFGGRRATKIRRWRASDVQRTLLVKSVPVAGKPPSFAGAIGTGFTLEVGADRTVVQIGDPITLTLTLRGEGLETASLPPLDAEGLLSAREFRVPGGTPTGELTPDGKRFTVVVRVMREGIHEIPALAYSWFDPKARGFATTHSRPIALSVRSAEVIGARDVQIADDAAAELRERRGEDEDGPAEAGPRARSFALTGADLAIERDPTQLLAAAAAPAAWQVFSLYGVAAALVALALLDRRRRDIDPALIAAQRLVAAERSRIESVAKLDPVEAVAVIADSLRKMLAQVPAAATPEIDAFIGECDARSYAPAGRVEPLDGEFCARAVSLARSIEEKTR